MVRTVKEKLIIVVAHFSGHQSQLPRNLLSWMLMGLGPAFVCIWRSLMGRERGCWEKFLKLLATGEENETLGCLLKTCSKPIHF